MADTNYPAALSRKETDDRKSQRMAFWDEEADERDPSLEYADVEPPSSIFTTLRYSEAMINWEANHNLPGTSHDKPRTRFYMLQYHLDRLKKAAECFKYPTHAFDDENGLARMMVDVASSELSLSFHNDPSRLSIPVGRVRVVIESTGEAKVACLTSPLKSIEREETYFPASLQIPEPLPTPNCETPIYRLYLCPFPTEPSAYTRHKTSCRDMYAEARVACGLPAQPTSSHPVEILLWSPEGRVMEGSLTSVYFYRTDAQGVGRWVTPSLQSGGNDGTTRRWALGRGLCVAGSIYVEGRNGDGVDGVKEGELCWISNGFRGFQLARVRKSYYDRAVQERHDKEVGALPSCHPLPDEAQPVP